MWMKVDDRMHAHRKTRHVVRSSDIKVRDIAPMGLWVMAGSWASQNATDGWVPEHELDRWDDDWEDLASRLVTAGYWWPEVKDEEPGYSFVDWEDYNPVSKASAKGEYGNHVRWHINRKQVDPECEHCPQEPVDETSIAPESPSDRTAIDSDIAPDSHPESEPESLNVALPVPVPVPQPDPKDFCAPADAVTHAQMRDAQKVRDSPRKSRNTTPDRFEEFWNTYNKKQDRKRAQQKWKLALKKKDVTADLLIDRAATYIRRQAETGDHPKFTKDPATWLNGENWNDETPTPLTLVRDPNQPTRNGIAFLAKCPTCNAPQEDTHYDDCPNQNWQPNTEGVGL